VIWERTQVDAQHETKCERSALENIETCPFPRKADLLQSAFQLRVGAAFFAKGARTRYNDGSCFGAKS